MQRVIYKKEPTTLNATMHVEVQVVRSVRTVRQALIERERAAQEPGYHCFNCFNNAAPEFWFFSRKGNPQHHILLRKLRAGKGKGRLLMLLIRRNFEKVLRSIFFFAAGAIFVAL